MLSKASDCWLSGVVACTEKLPTSGVREKRKKIASLTPKPVESCSMAAM